MTDAVNSVATVEDVTATPQQQEVQAEDDLAAGFNKVHGEKGLPSPESKTNDKPAEAKPEEKPAPEQKPEATPGAKPADTPAKTADEPRIAGMTETELKAALAKGGEAKAHVDAEVRKVFGKLGEIQRTVQDLSKSLSAGRSGRKITADLLKRVNDELPGLGDALAQDLSEILGGAEAAQDAASKQGKTIDLDAYHQEKLAPALAAMEARIAQVSESAQLELVTYIHPDFEQTVQGDEFKKWLDTLAEERRKEVVESPRAMVAAKAVTEFKEWKVKAAKEAAKQKNRLEGAITPRGGGAPPTPQQPDEEADFAAGYKKAVKK